MNYLNADDLNTRLPYFFENELDYLKNLGSKLIPGNVVVLLGFGPAIAALAVLEGADGIPFEFFAVDNANFTGELHLEAAGHKGRVTVIEGLSWEVADQFSYKSIDLLIIDACHEYDCVIKDIKAWWGKLKVGGIAFFHDYLDQDGTLSEGVYPAIEKCKRKSWEELDQPGVSIVYRRIK